MEEDWFQAPMLRLAISSASLKIFSEALHHNLPVTLYGQASRSMDEENCLV